MKLRITVAIGAGLITGVMVIALMQFLNGLLTPEADQTTELIGLLIAFGVGSLTAGAVARLVSVHVTPLSATICGIILMMLGLVNLFVSEHPIWFVISSTLIYIPTAWLGAWMIKINR